MDCPFVAAAGTVREIEFQQSLLRVFPGDSPAPQVEALEQLLSTMPKALVPQAPCRGVNIEGVRIVSLIASATEMVHALGLGEFSGGPIA